MNTGQQLRVKPRTQLHTSMASIAAATAVLTLAACAANDPAPGAGVRLDDSSITARVKSLFLDSTLVDGRAIRVETKGGTVLLSGVAASHAEKTAASEISLGVSGVRLVQNEITVRQ